MATEQEVFENTRNAVMQAAGPLLGSMKDRAAFQADEIKRRQDLLDDQRKRDQARADWIERFNMQTNAAKAAAKELRDFTTSEREARQKFQAAESDWQFFRKRQAEFEDRGYDTSKEEKEIRLKAVQFGMANAMEASIEDVYKHIYKTAPEELARIKRKQSEAFKKINPEAYAAYEEALNERANILTEMNTLISANAGGPSEQRIVEALLRKLGPKWALNSEDIAKFKQEGIPGISAWLAKDENEKLRLEFDQALDDVTEQLTTRDDRIYRDKLARLLKLEKISQETINRVRQMDPSIFISKDDEKKDLINKVKNNQGNETLGGGENKFGLPPVNNNINAALNAETPVVDTPAVTPSATPAVTPAVAPTVTDAEETGETEGFDFSNTAGALMPTQASTDKTINLDSFGPVPKTSDKLYQEKETLEGNLMRQDKLLGRMKGKGGDISRVRDAVLRNQARLKQIDEAISVLENPKPVGPPMRPEEYITEGQVLKGMGYPNPNRRLSNFEEIYRRNQGDAFIDPRTLGPEERRMLEATGNRQPRRFSWE